MQQRRTGFWTLVWVFAATLLIVSPRFAHGQGGGTGTILGTVTDSSGAIVPNAKVQVKNTGTNFIYSTETSSAGDFSAPSLNPGPYTVTVEAPSFQKAVTDTITLAVDQKARIDVHMKPGAASDTITVEAAGVQLDTDSAELSSQIGAKQMNALPLNGRNFMTLLLVGAGAVTVGGEQGTMRAGQGNAMSINGGRPESNNYTLDGLINTDTSLVTPAVILSQDAIQEFKVQSGNYSAEYGFSANQINIISKSGTNSIHGSLFEFNRNDAYDARGPFQTSIPPLRQNQFGYVAGGPVYIPKLYDGRNKTFWLANYEGWRITSGGTIRDSVPNPPVLMGDFSNEPLPVFGTDACTTALKNNKDCLPIDPETGQPFPGNKIPSNRITSRLALAALANPFFASPTPGLAPENSAPGVINRQVNVGFPLTSNQQTYRGDQNLGKFGQIFGRYTKSNYNNQFLNGSDNINIAFLALYEDQTNWEISHTINLGPTKVNNFRFGYLHATAPQGAAPGLTPSADFVNSLGLTGTFQTFGPLQLTYPGVGFSNYAPTGGSGNAYTGSAQPAWEFADSFSMVKGRHTIGMGVDYRTWQLQRNLADDFLGDYNFSPSTVATNNTGCPTVTCGTGNEMADFLLGYYSGASTYQPGPQSPTDQAGNPQVHQFSYFAPYITDSFKATPNLTLDLGLRWDYRAAPYETHNHFFWLDTQNPLGGMCYADTTLSTNGVAPEGNGVYRYCGSNIPKPASKTPFAPRFGFAYRLPSAKAVVRGGYGIFWDSSEGREIDDSGDLYPYSIRTSLNPTNNPAAPKLTNNLFIPYGALGPIDPNSLTFIAVIQSENPINPYIQMWSLGVQRELSRNTTLEMNYIGTKGTHFLNRRQIAQPYGIPDADLPYCQADPSDVTHNCPVNTRLPYQHFPGFYINSDWHGYSNYNGMNVKVEHRSANLAGTAVYTWAKSMDDKSATAGIGASGSGYQGFQDNHNPQKDYGLSDFSVGQRFVASFVYQLPFGRGQKFGSSVNRAADLAIGGWQVTGIATFQQGFPYSIGASDSAGLLFTQAQRASLVPGCNPRHGFTKSLTKQFNTDCFYQPAIGVYGNTGRNILTQPGIRNWDLGFIKNFPIWESVLFSLRVESFNTFNHPQYNVNVGGFTASGSGGGSSVDNGFGDPQFGQITQASPGRIIQLGGKLTF